MIPLHRIGTMLSLGMPGFKSDFVSCLAQRGVRSLGNFSASGQHQHTLNIFEPEDQVTGKGSGVSS